MPDYKLYCFGESGNAYKVALTLELAGCAWQARFVDFFNGETRSTVFKSLNPMGEVPVLIHGDIRLSQSGVIQEYISEQTGKLGGKDAAGRREILRWILWDNHRLSSQAGMTRFLMNFMPEDKRPAEVINFTRKRLTAAYNILNTALESRDWLVGDAITAADISCCSYLYYPEPFGFERAEFPAIDRWLGRISALPAWKHPYDLMPRERNED